MEIISGYYTDVGIQKKVNEDSLCLKVAKTNRGTIVMAVLCDGMGGLSKGELASAAAVRTFNIWFERELPYMMEQFSIQGVKEKWGRLIQALNRELREYGRKKGIHLGTTLTAVLIVEEEELLIAHIGDTRVYELKEAIQILTTDHTLVARERKLGLLTEKEVETDPRRNILLQCVGESRFVHPEFIHKRLEKDCTYVLCSDGFRHQISKEEIYQALQPKQLKSEEIIQEKAADLVELCKSRMEGDNISVIVIRT